MSWERKKLHEVCDIQSGLWKGKKEPFTSANVLRNTNFTKSGELSYDNVAELEVETKQLEKRTLQRGDIILEKSGGGDKTPVGRVCFFNLKSDTPYSLSNFTARLRVIDKNQLNPLFVHRFLYFLYLSGKTEVMQKHSTGIRNLQLTQYKDIDIPLPPLPVQKQIVEKLDAAFAGIDKAHVATQKNIENAEALFLEYLDGFLYQKLKNLNETTLKNVCDFVRGPFGGSLKKSIFVDDGYAVYEQKNAIYNNFDEVRYFISKSKFQEMERFEVKPDDLIMSCSGTLGKIAIAPKNLKKGIINQALLKLTPKEKIFNRYVQYYLSSNYFQNHLNEISGGAAQTNVPSVKILKQSPIKVPDLESQETLVSHLDNFKKKNIYLTDLYSQKKRNLLQLKSSILNQAFSGELIKEAT